MELFIIVLSIVGTVRLATIWHDRQNHPERAKTAAQEYAEHQKAKQVITSAAQIATVATVTTAHKLVTTKEKKKN